MSAAEHLRPYFDAKWWAEGTTAERALAEAKVAAVKPLRQKIAEIEALTFEAFAQRCCDPSVQPETIHAESAGEGDR